MKETGLEQTMTFIGWGVVGEPDGAVAGQSIDVTGYNAADYWRGDTFLGPDLYGIVPVYERADGSRFPSDARVHPYLA